MSTTPGVFDETLLLNIQATADQLLFDDRIKQQYVPQINVLNAIRAVQTANLSFPKVKTQNIDINWINTCGLECDDNTPCEITPTRPSTNSETKEVYWNKIVQFGISEDDVKDNQYWVDDFIPRMFLKADKELAECFAAYAMGRIDAFRGDNKNTVGKGVVSGLDTYIQAGYWTSAIVPYFNRTAILNRFTSPVFLSGNNLYEQMDFAQMMAANANGKGDYVAFNGLKMYFDLFNVDTVNDPLLKTYMLSMGSLAMANWYKNPLVPEQVNVDAFNTRYRIPSRFIPGFYYDVYYKPLCDGDDRIDHTWKVQLYADVFVNPEGCEEDNTGVLSFVCGEPDQE